ncbi:pentatricopeptide repeat-containing protein At2g44880-like [Cucurbita moschata]|uniref:Pentatricopeptide repeat-containing protein At2g44880-like n=1 Tax=Cucurbita moschata TaxID=3662 RepID=A0A6J1E3U0_CUCMO|nr:pentatricopeptide repeat-containing protein At2g44880-like [Cucurbita moschata]
MWGCDEAKKVFEEIGEKNICTWNVLISGYVMNGQGGAALQAFSMMLMEIFKPDEVTFLGVFCACCHQGLVTDRAGLLEEALELIQSTSMEPSLHWSRPVPITVRSHVDWN